MTLAAMPKLLPVVLRIPATRPRMAEIRARLADRKAISGIGNAC
jgi:hypothetical protein